MSQIAAPQLKQTTTAPVAPAKPALSVAPIAGISGGKEGFAALIDASLPAVSHAAPIPPQPTGTTPAPPAALAASPQRPTAAATAAKIKPLPTAPAGTQTIAPFQSNPIQVSATAATGGSPGKPGATSKAEVALPTRARTAQPAPASQIAVSSSTVAAQIPPTPAQETGGAAAVPSHHSQTPLPAACPAANAATTPTQHGAAPPTQANGADISAAPAPTTGATAAATPTNTAVSQTIGMAIASLAGSDDVGSTRAPRVQAGSGSATATPQAGISGRVATARQALSIPVDAAGPIALPAATLSAVSSRKPAIASASVSDPAGQDGAPGGLRLQAVAAPASGALLPAASPATPAQAAPAQQTTSAPAPTAPALQVAQALVGLAATDGTHRVIVQLSPSELGRVQISIERSADGTSVINVTTERPETFAIVQADSAQLHAALDQAGISPHGRTLRFNLATDDSESAISNADPATAATSGPTPAPRPTLVHAPGSASDSTLNPDRNGQNPTGATQPNTGADAGGRNGQSAPHDSQPHRSQSGAIATASFLQPDAAGTTRIAVSHAAVDITA